uniref:Peptidoglycan-associated lipoprotein n=1 Tax=Magnetococcus massalia (strain MO-1) TaxID=451514 RepID=A0A1S7LJY4_MAGMO|nr:Putative Outer membrane lipoprotein omp16/pal [Candidatus Magnetococcus massalia]
MKRKGLLITAILLAGILTGCGAVPKDGPNGGMRQDQLQKGQPGSEGYSDGKALNRPSGSAESLAGGVNGGDGSQYQQGSWNDGQGANGADGGQPQNMIFFGYDSDALSYEAQDILAQNARYFVQANAPEVIVEGHCDERGTREYNLALGQKRADAVRRYLNSQGVPWDRIRTISFGKERPLYTGHNETAWTQNRRAVLRSNP